MASIEKIVKLRKQAEKAVADMSDHELKLAAFEVIFEFLLEEAEDEEGEEEEPAEEVSKPEVRKKSTAKKKAPIKTKAKTG